MSFAANTLNPANLELPEAILKTNTPTDTWPIINNNTWSFTCLQKCFFVISNVSQIGLTQSKYVVFVMCVLFQQSPWQLWELFKEMAAWWNQFLNGNEVTAFHWQNRA